jgi:predicted dehydrogenase
MDTAQKVIRIAVAGLGRAGKFFHCEAIADSAQFELAGVQDARLEVSSEVASQYKCRHYESYDELISDPLVDVVVVAVPTRDHYELAIQAIKRGKNVLIEKPFATNPGQAKEIFEEGVKAGVFVGAYNNRRFDPDVLALRKILQSGVLGEIVKLSIHLHSFSRRNDWQTFRSMGGGAVANWGSHALDWCFYLFGCDIRLSQARLLQTLNSGDAEDSFVLFLEVGSTLIEIEFLNCAAIKLPRWHVVGQFGTALSEGNAFKVRYCDPARLTPLESDPNGASNGTYAIKEDLAWTEETIPWGHWDNRPPFLEMLYGHLVHGQPVAVTPEEVLGQIGLMEEIRKHPIRLLKQPVNAC